MYLRRSTIDASVVASALMGAAAGYSVVTESGGATQIVNNSGGVVATLGGSTAGAAPAASLHWMLYDEQMKTLLDAGFVSVNSSASVTDAATLAGAHQELALTVPTIARAGYLRIEVRHDAAEDVDVYFDDLWVEHGHGLLVQENHYDPWGST